MIEYILMFLYVLSALMLILFVLLQPGKSGASEVFGGGINSAAFGPRGTQSVLAKVTIGAAATFFLIAFLFSIPGVFERKSIGETVPAQSQPLTPIPQPPTTEQPGATPAPVPEGGQPAPPEGDQ